MDFYSAWSIIWTQNLNSCLFIQSTFWSSFRLMIIYCPLHWLKEVLLHDYFFIQWATNKHLYLLSFHTSIEFRMGKTIEHWLLKYLLFAALFHLQMESEMGLYIRMLRLSLWVKLATCLASPVLVHKLIMNFV